MTVRRDAVVIAVFILAIWVTETYTLSTDVYLTLTALSEVTLEVYVK